MCAVVVADVFLRGLGFFFLGSDYIAGNVVFMNISEDLGDCFFMFHCLCCVEVV